MRTIMEGPDYLRFVLALAFVLALMGLLGYLAKRFGWGGIGKMMPGKRLAVLESRPLDGRHKLVLTKCDDREYLLLLSHDHGSVIADLSKKPDLHKDAA